MLHARPGQIASLVVTSLSLSTCVSTRDDGDPFGTGVASTQSDTSGAPGETGDGLSAEGTGSGGPSGSGSSDGATGSDDGGIKFDTPEGESASATGGDGTTGCKKIDFLFVIDNSGSMAPHQQNLIANFGPFIDTIAAQVQGKDYHVMALDSDGCDVDDACAPTSCGDTLGAGQVRDCNVPGGIRYMTSDLDLQTLKSTFQCVANVGDQGSADEMPMSALVDAVDPLNVAGACNEGFVRDDAILVVTVISDDHSGWFGDDNENGFGGTPQSWYDAVVAVKGKPENVVVLGLYALLSDQSCIGFGPEESDQFIEFTEKFGSHGIVGSVCSPDYNSFFQQAVALIDTTCDEFEPEG